MSQALRRAKGRHEFKVEVRRAFRLYCPLTERPHPYDLPHERWYRKGRITGRDSMRQKCYDAEAAVRHQIGGESFADLAECARYLRAVMETKWFQRRFVYTKGCILRYSPQRSGAVASNWNAKIELGPWALQNGELILLHELAHIVSPSEEHHGRLWARTFVDLVGFRMGRDAAKLLNDSFRAHNIITKPYRRMSEEQKRRMAKVLEEVRS